MSVNFLNSAWDALSSSVAILNETGIIVYVNQAWRTFADNNGLAMANYGVGSNYLDYCKTNQADNKKSDIAQGIRKVITGKKKNFSLEYSCHSPSERRWFLMQVSPFIHEGNRYTLVMHENITPQKIAENHLKNILQNAPIGMAIVSLDGLFMESNHALEQLLGYSKAELLNLTCQQITHPDDIQSDEKQLRKLLLDKHRSYRIEKRLIRKDGNFIWANITVSVLCNEIGSPIFIIKQIQDVSDRVLAEAALRDSEHRLSVVLNNMPALIGYWNKNLINEFGNNAYIDWFGIDPSQIKGKPIREVIGDYLYGINLPYIEKVLQGETQVFERTIVDTKGEEHYTLASYIPDISDQGVNGFFVLVTDITQIKLTELALRKSAELSKMVLSVSIDGFIFSDLQGRFVDVSQSYCDMLGYSKTELLTMSVPELEAIENETEIRAHFDKIIANGFDRFETMHRRKDGTRIDVEVSVAYLPNKSQIFAFIRDISQRKQSEKLKIQNLVQQRDVLIREIHHRIKNHLQGVVGFLGLYSNTSLETKKVIQDISAKISSIAVVYGIQGKKNQDQIYLCEITREICDSLTHFGSVSNRIHYSATSNRYVSLPTEIAVPVAVVINELIVNAIKHGVSSPVKTVDVTLSIENDGAILDVRNKVSNETLLPDFESGNSVGVGLSLVHAMLPRHGARLSLKRVQDSVWARLILSEPVVSIHSKKLCH